MALSDLTLGHLSLHPSRQQYDISDKPIAQVGPVVKAYMAQHDDKNMATPDNMAVTFYAFSQMLGYLSTIYDKAEPLTVEDADILKRYFTFMDAEGTRAAVYLLIICIRECRHTHANPQKDYLIGQEVSHHAVNWIRAHKSGENYTSLWTHPPQCTLGELATAIRRFFYEQSYSSSYGGKPWGGIADCIESFIYGRSSAEVMMDTNWTLSHNNGPIFNKGMLYKTYSAKLIQILDVQRAGMILQGIHEKHDVLNYAVTDTMRTLVEHFLKRHPDAIDKPYIDWFRLEQLGALGEYQHYKKAQVKMWGPSEYQTVQTDSVDTYEHAHVMPEIEPTYNVDGKIQLKVVQPKRPKQDVVLDSLSAVAGNDAPAVDQVADMMEAAIKKAKISGIPLKDAIKELFIGFDGAVTGSFSHSGPSIQEVPKVNPAKAATEKVNYSNPKVFHVKLNVETTKTPEPAPGGKAIPVNNGGKKILLIPKKK
ncbi:hypothetical protein EVC30_142 [Rhizobium phage RHph_Y1_11]|nr:hypothetical protein EVC30_142 [Rhizobium phage RHph_Y1_11]